ncbi:MAG: FtsX-like permease family protein, partial [Cyclobacteriaceae bacterium]
PEVSAAGFSNSIPSRWVSNWSYYTDEDKRRQVNPDHIFVTKDFGDVLGVEMAVGSFFTGRATDTMRVVVNEAFIKALDWPLSEAVGKVVKRSDEEKYRIAGVMNDFHLGSFKDNLRPLLLRYHENTSMGYGGSAYMLMRISGNYEHVIDELVSNWSAFAPEDVLNYSFLDDEFNSLYEIERNFGKIFTTFSVMAILIACLGLFALSAFMLQQRLKEVAMRKVLGATSAQIISIFVKSFLMYIALGAIMAIVVGYYLADQWLANFAYRMGLNPLYFLVPVLLVSTIAIVTIVLQILKSGNVNPAVLLKNE